MATLVDIVNAHSRDLTRLMRQVEELTKRLEVLEAGEATEAHEAPKGLGGADWSNSVTDAEYEEG